MSRKAEIGSNFWLTSQEIGNTCPLTKEVYGLGKWKHSLLTSSGRGAIRLLFQNLPQVKKVLLPEYTCSSVISPIESLGISCSYYPLNKDLSVNREVLCSLIDKFASQAVYFQSYYGFDTLKSIRDDYPTLQEKGIIVVEDITHSWLCDFNSTVADYSVASLRKWLQLPDGGVLLSNTHSLNYEMTEEESSLIVSEFIQASVLKEKYFDTFNPSDKEAFRQHYINAKDLLQQDETIYSMSKQAQSVLSQIDFSEIVRKRKENAKYIHTHLCNNDYVESVVEWSDDSVPLYYPIFVKENRSLLQKELAKNAIYCPIHWPVPSQVSLNMSPDASFIYTHVLSLICDQRYDLDDMLSIIQIVNCFPHDY